MTSLVCAACGAPLVESDTTKCDHCGAELTAGDKAWVLDAVMRPEEAMMALHTARARVGAGAGAGVGVGAGVGAGVGVGDYGALVPDIADPRERRILFARMAQLMASDGAIDRKERRLLHTRAMRWSIAEEEVDRVLSNPPPGGSGGAAGGAPPRGFLPR